MSDKQIDLSPPAFPLGAQEYPNGGIEFPNQGMSLRDYFAGQALAGICGNPQGPVQSIKCVGWGLKGCGADDVAHFAFCIADAMIKARDSKPKES